MTAYSDAQIRELIAERDVWRRTAENAVLSIEAMRGELKTHELCIEKIQADQLVMFEQDNALHRSHGRWKARAENAEALVGRMREAWLMHENQLYDQTGNSTAWQAVNRALLDDPDGQRAGAEWRALRHLAEVVRTAQPYRLWMSLEEAFAAVERARQS